MNNRESDDLNLLEKLANKAKKNYEYKMAIAYDDIIISQLQKEQKNHNSPLDSDKYKEKIIDRHLSRCLSGLLLHVDVKKTDLDLAKLILENVKKDFEFAVDNIQFSLNPTENTNQVIKKLLSLAFVDQVDNQAAIRVSAAVETLMAIVKERIDDVNLIMAYINLYKIAVSTDDKKASSEILNRLLTILDKESDNHLYLDAVIIASETLMNLCQDDLEADDEISILCIKAFIQKRDIPAAVKKIQFWFDQAKLDDPGVDDSFIYDYLYDHILKKIIHRLDKNKKTCAEDIIKILNKLKPKPFKIINTMKNFIDLALINHPKHAESKIKPLEKQKLLSDAISDLKRQKEKIQKLKVVRGIISNDKSTLADKLLVKDYPSAIKHAKHALYIINQYKDDLSKEEFDAELSYFHLAMSSLSIFHDPFNDISINHALENDSKKLVNNNIFQASSLNIQENNGLKRSKKEEKDSIQVIFKNLTIEELLDKMKEAGQIKDLNTIILCQHSIIEKCIKMKERSKLLEDKDYYDRTLYYTYRHRFISQLALYVETDGADKLLFENAINDFELVADRYQGNRTQKLNQALSQIIDIIVSLIADAHGRSDRQECMQYSTVIQVLLNSFKPISDLNLMKMYFHVYQNDRIFGENQETKQTYDILLNLLDKDTHDRSYLEHVVAVSTRLMVFFGQQTQADLDSTEKLCVLCIKAKIKINDITSAVETFKQHWNQLKCRYPEADESNQLDAAFDRFIQNSLRAIKKDKKTCAELVEAFTSLDPQPIKMIAHLQDFIKQEDLKSSVLNNEKLQALSFIKQEEKNEANWRAEKDKFVKVKNDLEKEINELKKTLKENNPAKLSASAKKDPKNRITNISLMLTDLGRCETAYHVLSKKILNSISEIDAVFQALPTPATKLKSRKVMKEVQIILETQQKNLETDIQKILDHKQSLNKLKEDAEEAFKDLILQPYEHLLSSATADFEKIKVKLNDLKKLKKLPIEEKISLLEQTKTDIISLSKQYRKAIKKQLKIVSKDNYSELDDSIKQSVETRIKFKQNEISDVRAQLQKWTSAKVSQLIDRIAAHEKEKKATEEAARKENVKAEQLAQPEKKQQEAVRQEQTNQDDAKPQIKQTEQTENKASKRNEKHQAKKKARLQKKEDERKKQEEHRKKEQRNKEEALKIAIKQREFILDHLSQLQSQSTDLISQLNQLIQKCAQQPDRSSEILSSINGGFSSLEQLIKNYEADLRAIDPACQDHGKEVSDYKNQLKSILSQRDISKKNIIYLQTQLFNANWQKVVTTAHQIITICGEGSEQLKALDAKQFDTISDKHFEIEKSLAEMTANCTSIKQKRQEAIAKYKLAKNCQAYVVSNSIDVAHVDVLDRELNNAKNILEKAEHAIEKYKHELNVKKSTHLASFSHFLADKQKAAALDYLSALQKRLRGLICLRGGVAISAGDNLYNPSSAARIDLNDIDGTIYTQNPDELANLLTLDEKCGGAGFKLARTCRGIFKDSQGCPIINPRTRQPIIGTFCKNVVKEIGGVSVELTIAHRDQYRTQFISPLVSLGQLHLFDEKEYNAQKDNYDIVEKINNNFIIAIERNLFFKKAVQGWEWYAPYDPNIHKNYCYALLKSHRKSKQLQNPGTKYEAPPESYLSYQDALWYFEDISTELVYRNQEQPDYEIDKVLREIKTINDDTRPFVEIYCRILLRSKYPRQNNAFTQSDLKNMFNKLVNYLKDDYENILSDDKDKPSEGIEPKDEDKPSAKIKTKGDIVIFELKNSNRPIADAKKKSADPDKSSVEDAQPLPQSPPPKSRRSLSIFRDSTMQLSIRKKQPPQLSNSQTGQRQSFGSK